MIPGEFLIREGEIELNAGRHTETLAVTNNGDRPVQVGSHYHFVETNNALQFNRGVAMGMRLDMAAGTSVRFEPGQNREVRLVALAGKRTVFGHNNLTNGPVDDIPGDDMVDQPQQVGVAHEPDPRGDGGHISSTKIKRRAYADMFGPTTGDRVRLGDMDLIIEVEKDFTTYGEELKFGGGKTVRDGMGQSHATSAEGALDMVITNALIVDYWGIVKADIGVKDGNIAGIGKAGNPHIQPGVTLIVGPATDIVAGEGKIVTAGAVDTNAHFISPGQASVALASGITTMVGGGAGPSAGTCATSCTPSKTYIRQMLQGWDELPLNIGIIGKGNASRPDALVEQIKAGVCGLKLNECWGTTPAAIDSCLSVADKYDVQCHIHSDTLNESGYVENTIAAFRGRNVVMSHVEGAGGGHAPDIIKVAGLPNVLPSSTTVTRPYTYNTLDEQLDMVMVCDQLDPKIAEDIAYAESRIRRETIAAEDILHDLGAISIIGSGSQAMGRCGEIITRTWQTADKMKKQRGALPEDGARNDNFRVKRYISKYSINPALAQGFSHLVGSIEVGKLADLVVWDPAWFGTKPSMVLKSGFIAWSQMGAPDASLPTVQPVISRPMFAPSVPAASMFFVSYESIDSKVVTEYDLRHRIASVSQCRGVGKNKMILNDKTLVIKVDPETYEVRADGELLTCEPASVLPLAQRYCFY